MNYGVKLFTNKDFIKCETGEGSPLTYGDHIASVILVVTC
jgi:hypothetical protein